MPETKTPNLIIQLEPKDMAKIILAGLLEVANDAGHEIDAVYDELEDYDKRGLLCAASKIADYVAERIREADKVQ